MQSDEGLGPVVISAFTTEYRATLHTSTHQTLQAHGVQMLTVEIGTVLRDMECCEFGHGLGNQHCAQRLGRCTSTRIQRGDLKWGQQEGQRQGRMQGEAGERQHRGNARDADCID